MATKDQTVPDAPAETFGLDPETRAFYCTVLVTLQHTDVPFLVGGAYAFARYTGIERHTRDLDVFVRAEHVAPVLEALAAQGCRSELTFQHWLGKAYCGESYVDVIFSSGNGIADVDDEWFEHAVDGTVLDIPVKLVPAEEIIWQKALIMERERYDGADVAHLLRAQAEDLHWRRLLRRFGPHWRVLLSHLVLFGFIYPAERDLIPRQVIDVLLLRLQRDLERQPPADPVCNGAILSREQYLVDIERWGYKDPRLLPRGGMSSEEIDEWTAAIGS
jgi:hypothetical protein